MDLKLQPTYRIFAGVAVALAVIGASVSTDFSWQNLWTSPEFRAQQLYDRGDYSEAAELFRDPQRRGAALFADGKFEEAAASFGQVDDKAGMYNRGTSLIMQGKYDPAIASFDRAIELDPNFQNAVDNRAIAIARRDRLASQEDDSGGTGGQLEADGFVFDDRPKNSNQTQTEPDGGENTTAEEMQAMWLRRVQTQPQDFLRAKFQYQAGRQEMNQEGK